MANFAPTTGFDPCDGDDPRVTPLCNPTILQPAGRNDREFAWLPYAFAFLVSVLIYVGVNA